MLRLHRVRLVNWHYFDDVLIDLDMTTLIAGDNGSGKSTIIDAIQYALIADIRKIRFNAAAAEVRTERTLEGYCRCKIGAAGLEYYRNDTITHIMLEFQDTEKTFIAGVQVEASAASELKEHFWLLGHGRLEDVSIAEGSRMLIPRTFKTQIKQLGGTVCKTKTEYNSRLTQLLHVHRKNAAFNPYFEALIRSVSFRPLHSVDRFVCDYILEERQVDISAMKENLLNYKEAEREALLMEEKIAQLEQIAQQQLHTEQLYAQVLKQEYLEKRLPVEIGRNRQRSNREEHAKTEHALQLLQQQMADNQQLKGNLQHRYDEAHAALSSNDTHRMYLQFTRDKDELEQRLLEDRRQIDTFQTTRGQIEALLDRPLGEDLEAEISRISQEYKQYLKDHDRQEQLCATLIEESRELHQEEYEVSRGILRYPENTQMLQKALKEEGIEAFVLADMLEVLRPEWQNAVEGWLNTQRFNILVEEHSFQKAVEIYDRLPRSIAGVGIPHLSRMTRSEIRPGSLAELVEAHSPLARRYCSYLLGDVMMSSLAHLKDHEKAVTIECMKYSGKTASRIKESIYSRWFIGASAKKQRLERIRARLKELEGEIQKAQQELEELSSMSPCMSGQRMLSIVC